MRWSIGGWHLSSFHFSWEYDAAGRLISETADASGGSLFNDYSETFVYDLTGNRVKQTKVSDNSSGNGSTTETTDYVYDANDRLLIETSTVGSDEKTSVYTYNKTQQTEKETTEYEDGGLGEPVEITTTQTFEYDLQGKLSKSTTTKDGGQALGSDGNSSTVYEYDSAGNRIAATTTKQNTVGGSTTTRIEYLTDSENPTGYSQVLTETEFAVTVDANGNEVQTPIKEVVYTIGHDQISQTNLSQWNTTTKNWELKTENYFGTDGHGSVRVLYDAVAAIVQGGGAQQLYHFDAYGNLLNFGAGTLNANTLPLTTYGYSGEAFDFNIGQQYLRARWYDPTTGRFNSLDPFAGNSDDPQSFHKYAYVHGDPIQGVDPTGQFLIGAILGGFSARSHYLTTEALKGKALMFSAKGIGAVLGGIGVAAVVFYAFDGEVSDALTYGPQLGFGLWLGHETKNKDVVKRGFYEGLSRGLMSVVNQALELGGGQEQKFFSVATLKKFGIEFFQGFSTGVYNEATSLIQDKIDPKTGKPREVGRLEGTFQALKPTIDAMVSSLTADYFKNPRPTKRQMIQNASLAAGASLSEALTGLTKHIEGGDTDNRLVEHLTRLIIGFTVTQINRVVDYMTEGLKEDN